MKKIILILFLITLNFTFSWSRSSSEKQNDEIKEQRPIDDQGTSGGDRGTTRDPHKE